MLEFIVLGQVPGTNFTITFSWLIAVVALVAGVRALQHNHKKHHHAVANTVDLITL